ncbi:MAG TPA: cyclic nucleotide-binding domain-containing protein [Geminicoccaceae bacterium]
MAERVDVAIIGSGPAGLSAGARAAGRGLSHVVLERTPLYADTIQKYQRGKFVMATPDILPLRSDISFQAGSREEILDKWGEEIDTAGMAIRYGAEVKSIKGGNGAGFKVTLQDGNAYEAGKVVLAIGVQGNLRKLPCPGADLPLVQYQLDDPEAYEGETIVVIGAGDSAIENAIALAKQNQVIIVNRRPEFARAKTGNLIAIEKAMANGTVEGAMSSSPVKVEPGGIELKTPTGNRHYRCDRIIARLGADPPRRFLESCGIQIPAGGPGFPEVSVTYETNVPGLYAIGALAGYPLIKHCMNQGYEVIETIAGHPVAPADEPLLVEKVIGMPGRPPVDQALEEIKTKVKLFTGLTTLQLRDFLLDAETHVLLAGETVFQRNDYGDTLFCVVSGSVEIELVDDRRPNAPPRTAVREEGDFFGEVALIAGRRRSGTVRARTDCVLIELARRSAVKLLNSVAEARAIFERTTIMRQLQEDLLPDLTDAEAATIVDDAEIIRFEPDAVLMEEGAEDDRSVYLIRSGSVTVSKRIEGRDVVLAYEPAGHIVGEMALLRNVPRNATVRAAIATEAIRIDADAFQRLLDVRPELRLELERVVLDRLAQEPVRESRDQWSGITDFLVDQGIGEATDILLIDESLCIRCDNCEKACAEVHEGISRLDREAGPTFAMIHVPTSCRHCEHPHCMTDCPPDALHRAASGEVWIDESCIGCGNCASNCPYGVIQLAAPPPPKAGLLQWLLLGRGPGPGGYRRQDMLSKKKTDGPQPQKVAVKCDMCKGIEGGAACVRACPTGAAIRVSPRQFLDSMVHRS